MKELDISREFRRDMKRMASRGYDVSKIHQMIDLLCQDLPLPERARPHKLSGGYIGLWDCHIKSDWILIYETDSKYVFLYRTGTHADLFK